MSFQCEAFLIGKRRCPSFSNTMDTCKHCNRFFCDSHLKVCSKCNKKFCGSHSESRWLTIFPKYEIHNCEMPCEICNKNKITDICRIFKKTNILRACKKNHCKNCHYSIEKGKQYAIAKLNNILCHDVVQHVLIPYL